MDPVYLDYAATAPVRPEVRAAMEPFADDVFGNPSSQHRWGRAASAALENARAEAADALGARPSEICFVRGGTEADNLAILGGCRALANGGEGVSLAVSAVEHHAILHAAEHFCGNGGARLTIFGVSPDGMVDLDTIREVASAGPTLISCM